MVELNPTNSDSDVKGGLVDLPPVISKPATLLTEDQGPAVKLLRPWYGVLRPLNPWKIPKRWSAPLCVPELRLKLHSMPHSWLINCFDPVWSAWFINLNWPCSWCMCKQGYLLQCIYLFILVIPVIPADFQTSGLPGLCPSFALTLSVHLA